MANDSDSDILLPRISGIRHGSPKTITPSTDATKGLSMHSTVESPIGRSSTERKEKAMPPKPITDLKKSKKRT